MRNSDHLVAGGGEMGLCRAGLPGPNVAKPELRDKAQRRRCPAPVVRSQLHQDVVTAGFGVLDHDIEISVVVEYSGIDEFEFGVIDTAASVFLDEKLIRERPLR